MSVNKKRVLLLFFIPVLIAFVVGYYMYNKGPVNVVRKKGLAVDAVTLYRTYITDSAVANSRYSDKILEVSGTVSGVYGESNEEKHVMLKTGVEGASINCALADTMAVLPQAGSNIAVKGICIGILGDPDLGIMGDVILSRCVILSKK